MERFGMFFILTVIFLVLVGLNNGTEGARILSDKQNVNHPQNFFGTPGVTFPTPTFLVSPPIGSGSSIPAPPGFGFFGSPGGSGSSVPVPPGFGFFGTPGAGTGLVPSPPGFGFGFGPSVFCPYPGVGCVRIQPVPGTSPSNGAVSSPP